MKQKKQILQQDNMRECLGYLLHNLREKCKEQLPLDGASPFRSFATHMPVDFESFNCHYTSFAVVCQGTTSCNGKQVCLASIELHVLNQETMMDMMLPLLIGHKSEVSEFLSQRDEVIINQMKEKFESLAKDQ